MPYKKLDESLNNVHETTNEIKETIDKMAGYMLESTRRQEVLIEKLSELERVLRRKIEQRM